MISCINHKEEFFLVLVLVVLILRSSLCLPPVWRSSSSSINGASLQLVRPSFSPARRFWLNSSIKFFISRPKILWCKQLSVPRFIEARDQDLRCRTLVILFLLWLAWDFKFALRSLVFLLSGRTIVINFFLHEHILQELLLAFVHKVICGWYLQGHGSTKEKAASMLLNCNSKYMISWEDIISKSYKFNSMWQFCNADTNIVAPWYGWWYCVIWGRANWLPLLRTTWHELRI